MAGKGGVETALTRVSSLVQKEPTTGASVHCRLLVCSEAERVTVSLELATQYRPFARVVSILNRGGCVGLSRKASVSLPSGMPSNRGVNAVERQRPGCV